MVILESVFDQLFQASHYPVQNTLALRFGLNPLFSNVRNFHNILMPILT